ncbi:sugar-binding domain-containing protein [Flavobacterium ovatum]|uniref:sugar-binding domain-containing protein n=1 Tax=Flavobacterium ovatum TaxID=1928857 RepID=UPI00344DEA87
MKIKIFLLSFLAFTLFTYAQHSRESDFNFGWKFSLDQKKDAFAKELNDAQWRKLNLPHDWSIEAPFDEKLEGATGYLPGGLGWYRKHFALDLKSGQSAFVLFDGVYNNSEVWLNGKKLGENPYGYTPFYFDLTPYLNKSGDNVIAVKVDHTRYADCRWYTGSGIYRNVKLVVLNSVHIPIWGTYVTTPKVTKEQATVQIETKIKNKLNSKTEFTLVTKILNEKGKQVAKNQEKLLIDGNKEQAFTQYIHVKNPQLWDIETPNRYKVISEIKLNGKTLETYTTPFGIRSLRFTAGEGFFLNGKETLVKGVCLHHDAGLVGAAVPKGVWARRLKSLKEAGVNAIRTSHNPYSQEFLDLCDEMGFLVQDEIFDELDYPKDKRLNYHDRIKDSITRGYTNHFQKWGESDLKRTILRDRNHPSVYQWSIGNEIEWTYLEYRYATGFWTDRKDPQDSGEFWGSLPKFTPEQLKERYDKEVKGKYLLEETARRLNAWVKELDNTRPTTANLVIPQISHVSGYADAVDLVGYSYRNLILPWAQKHFPHKQVTINENPGTWDDWKQVIEYPGVFSMYMWTGIDYIGERDQKWPEKSGWGDILDLAGFKYQGFNYFKSIWVNKPHISIGTLPIKESGFTVDDITGQAVPKNKGSYKWRDSNMHWNYKKGEPIVVEVASNYAQVELFVNGRSLGSRSMNDSPERIFRWVVPFEEGTITAKAGFDGQEITSKIKTSSAPTSLKITTDKTTLTADGYDVAHIIVQLLDKAGNEVKTEDTKVTFDVQGDLKILGVDNGAASNIQNFQSNRLTTSQGRALMIVQSLHGKTGKTKITANSDQFKSETISISTKK